MKRLLALLSALLMLLTGCAAETEETTMESATRVVTHPDEASVETIQEISEMEYAAQLVRGLSIEEKVGQLFLARCPDDKMLEDIVTYHLGGYILFGRDFSGKTAEDVKSAIASCQKTASIPMLIAVDEEGGTVNRVSSNAALRAEPFASPRTLFSQGGLEEVLAVESEKASLLSYLGINVVMGPVCDITNNQKAFMYRRSLGQNPQTTGTFAAECIKRYGEYGVGGVLKHFPGYGDNEDTHVGVAVDNRSLTYLEQNDLVPFEVAIADGCDAILVSHTIVTALDADTPATLSEAVHEYIRSTMGFNGVLVTDDLAMQAITDTYGAGEAAVLAVLAGNDLLCASEYPVQYQAVLEAVQSGRISTDILDTAVQNILIWKLKLELM